MSLPCYQNFVDGQYLANKTGATFPVINPATQRILYTVEIADDSIRQAAIVSAKAGFEIWSAMSGMERGRILNRAVICCESVMMSWPG